MTNIFELASNLEHGYPSAERLKAAAMLRGQAAEIERLRDILKIVIDNPFREGTHSHEGLMKSAKAALAALATPQPTKLTDEEIWDMYHDKVIKGHSITAFARAVLAAQKGTK